MDDAGAARAATEHVVALGHRRVAFITGSDQYSISAARLEGYRQGMRDAGLGQDEALIGRGDFSYASGLGATEALLDLPDPPTAIVASNDQMALAALRVAEGRGMALPGRLSVVSFDDTPIIRFKDVTAIVQPVAAMASEAASLLIRAKAGEQDLPSSVTIPFALAIRSSTGPLSA